MQSLSQMDTATRHRAFYTLIGFIFIVLWDASGLDIVTTQWFYTTNGFALQSHFILETVLHEFAKKAVIAFYLALVVMVFKPVGVLKQLSKPQRLGMVLSILAVAIIVPAMKQFSDTVCPWDLSLFGGSQPFVSHWDWRTVVAIPGHCFPAGHAVTGFAFVAAYFWLNEANVRAAQIALGVALAVGFILGFAQQIRGAHFMSHTLWSAWICWVSGWFFASLLKRFSYFQTQV